MTVVPTAVIAALKPGIFAVHRIFREQKMQFLSLYSI